MFRVKSWKNDIFFSKRAKKIRHPAFMLFSYTSLIVGSFGLFDFNRSIHLSEGDRKEFKSLHDLSSAEEVAQVSQKLYDKAFHKVLEFDDIKLGCDLSIELFYLYKRVEKSKLRLKNHPFNNGQSDEQIGGMAAENCSALCQQMYRRTLIRNGHVIKWFKLLVQDQFIQIYVMPVLCFLGCDISN